MKTAAAIFLITIGSFTLLAQQKYFDMYTAEAGAVREFYRNNKPVLDSVFSRFDIEPRLALSIVAPEIGHYAVWRNLLETSAVQLFYVEMGTGYADFSVGDFQMKVSFIEKLEQAIQQHELRQFIFLTRFNSMQPWAIRKERLQRIQTLKYETCYVAAFIHVMKHVHKNLASDCAMLATAYNAGFWRSEEDLKKLSRVSLFPARGRVIRKFPYGEIAREYFENFDYVRE